MYQDPSGHAEALGKLLGQAVNKAKTTVKATTKPKSSPSKPAAKKPTAASAVSSIINNAANSVKKSTSSSRSSSSSSSSSSSESYASKMSYAPAPIPNGTLRYDKGKVSIPYTRKIKLWEASKDALESVYRVAMAAENLVHKVGEWWNDDSSKHYEVVQTMKSCYASWKNSKIGQCVTTSLMIALTPKVYVVKESIEFQQEHPKIAGAIRGVGTAIIVAEATAASGGTLLGLLGAVTKGATKYGVYGAIIGAPLGALKNSYKYMKEHGTIDGSTQEVLAGMAEGAIKFGKAGAAYGALKGGMEYLFTPVSYCFVAGTIVLTAMGTTDIEDVRAGDYVYAKDEETGEQKYMPVLEIYEREVNETYTVILNGESIETTANHPFYTIDEGWTNAEDLEAGDKVELSDGSCGEVDNVKKNELEEPVTVYNFCVMDYHTYYVGESEVFVHNECTPSVAEDVAEAAEINPLNGLPANQGYDSFADLKKAMGSAGEGNHWHHIVEQSQIGKSGFSVQQIQNTSNIISVDAATHAKITGYYNTTTFRFTNGLSVRDWLAGQSYEYQYEFGLDVLRQFGVIE